jgi:uncharacterized protein
MMEFSKKGSISATYMLRINEGERIIENMRNFLKLQDIKTASLSLVGAVKWAKIVTPDINKKDMPDRESYIDKHMEIVGHGNIVEGEPHIHAALGEKGGDGNCGHLVEAEAFVFVEAIIHKIEGIRVQRVADSSGFKGLVFE